jgi:hypothetical protein
VDSLKLEGYNGADPPLLVDPGRSAGAILCGAVRCGATTHETAPRTSVDADTDRHSSKNLGAQFTFTNQQVKISRAHPATTGTFPSLYRVPHAAEKQ